MAFRTRNGFVSATAALAASWSFVAITQPATAQEQQQQVITVHSAGLDGLLVSPKDAGLKNALRLLDERVVELPAELQDPSMPAPMISFVLDLLARPMSFRAALLPGIEDMNLNDLDAPPFIGQIDFYTASPDEAGTLAATLHEMIVAAAPVAPQPDPEHAGLFMADADGAMLRYGAGRVGGQNAVSIALNGYATEVARINLTGLPPGIQPAIAMEVNTAPIKPLIARAMEQAPPEQRPMIEMQMAMYGMDGDHPLRIIAAAGHAADRSHGMARVVNGRLMAAQQHMLPDSFLTAEDMLLIPADATVAEVGAFNPAYFTHMMNQVRAQLPPEARANGQDPFEMLQQQTGIDLQRDIIDNLGQTYWTYTADSTGGGLTGYVSIVELSDAAGMQDTLDNLTQMANQMAHGPARGYVRFMTREIGGRNMTVLTFPGIPVPLEISCAIIGDNLYSALSPQAVLFAASQAATPRRSILDNPGFREMGGSVPEGAMQIAFMDTPRLATSGYGLVSMGMSALANAVRSPTDAAREPGLIMPSVTELMEGAKATVYVTHIDGDDIVMVSQGDRSALVNLCGASGAMGGAAGVAMIGAAAGAMGAGVSQQAIMPMQVQASRVESMAQLRQLAMAVQMYAADHEDRMPESIDQLIEIGYLHPEMIDSPFGDAGEGFDFGLRGSGRMAEIRFPDRQILAWDRAMLQQGGPVNVAFIDGHVESTTPEELQMLLGHPSNEGLNLAGR